jgi:hypothetical protein
MFTSEKAGGEPAPDPTPAPPKRRTITLTHRAPISIVEDQWPVIAQGGDGFDQPGAPWSWSLAIRVRKEKQKLYGKMLCGGGRVIVHAKYTYWNETNEEHGVLVRVGHLLSQHEAVSNSNIWKHIEAVGEELRERIDHENTKKHVTGMIDRCFAALPPLEDF